jgi:6-pyruvoyltetrahydropterin/6-carboxytetrahydropterin synthase
MSKVSETLVYCASSGFEAARQLDSFPQGHRSRRLHGHSFRADVRAALPAGWASFPGAEVDDLRAALEASLAPLDYARLDALVDSPSDENLARWLRGRLRLPGPFGVAVRGARDAGAEIDSADRALVWRRYGFESAHRLPNVPAGHKCARMHGHGFETIVTCLGGANAASPADECERIDRLWSPIRDELHRVCLNDIGGLENPTSELIARWIWDRLESDLPGLARVTVYETARCGAHYDGRRFRIWRESSLDSALRLARAPEGDPRRRVHGHTYTLRLHLGAPLDAVMGWTLDFGDVKELFTPVFRRLDHQPLHELPGIEDSDVASLLRWTRRSSENALPALDRVDLYETPGCGAILSWGEDPGAAAA